MMRKFDGISSAKRFAVLWIAKVNCDTFATAHDYVIRCLARPARAISTCILHVRYRTRMSGSRIRQYVARTPSRIASFPRSPTCTNSRTHARTYERMNAHCIGTLRGTYAATLIQCFVWIRLLTLWTSLSINYFNQKYLFTEDPNSGSQWARTARIRRFCRFPSLLSRSSMKQSEMLSGDYRLYQSVADWAPVFFSTALFCI